MSLPTALNASMILEELLVAIVWKDTITKSAPSFVKVYLRTFFFIKKKTHMFECFRLHTGNKKKLIFKCKCKQEYPPPI